MQAHDDNEGNKWDNGYPSGGNYWSDYSGIDADVDGIGDSPYDIKSKSQDMYPLIRGIGINHGPDALFSVSPTSGNITTIFNFDASECFDWEDETIDLEVRWDWDDNGTWDTDWNTTKIIDHQFLSPGRYTVRLEVKDTKGLRDNVTRMLTVIIDTDGDGVPDDEDIFPEDPNEWEDTDNDGIGDNSDAFPFDGSDWLDSDTDGVGDNNDLDDDNDGVPDEEDDFPLDPTRQERPSDGNQILFVVSVIEIIVVVSIIILVLFFRQRKRKANSNSLKEIKEESPPEPSKPLPPPPP